MAQRTGMARWLSRRMERMVMASDVTSKVSVGSTEMVALEVRVPEHLSWRVACLRVPSAAG